MRRALSGLICTAFLLVASSAFAQFGESKTKGPRLDKALTQKIKVGVKITALGGSCMGITGSMPVPTAWAEQEVKIDSEDVSPLIKKVEYRNLGDNAKQMLIHIPQLPNGQEAHAYVTFEVKRYSLLPPEDPKVFQLPDLKKIDRKLLVFTGASPYIETNNDKIIAAAKEALEGKEDASAWEKVEAIYDWSRSKVNYKAGTIKGAVKALADGTGDCEEVTSLFIALCRVNHIPARMVWVPQHCYPEFYLTDADGTGYWIPCQGAGTKSFGGIPEHRPILQKGDNFKDPDRPNEKLRYVNEFMKAKAVKGAGQPQVEFSQEMLP